MTAPPEPSADSAVGAKRAPLPAAVRVGVGILGSRVFGLLRQIAQSASLGGLGSITADAFAGAFRVTNSLQNLLGEGALSASFIPVYRRLLVQGDREGARRLAAATGAILVVVVAMAVALGIWAAPGLVDLINSGFKDEKRDLAITYTRMFFPGIGLLVLSAWCLAIQNSHERFLLSYLAPIAWNVAMILAFVVGRHRIGAGTDLSIVARTAVWGSVIGAAAQLLVQLPTVMSLIGGKPDRLDFRDAGLRTVFRNFAPVTLSRGVVQVSAFVDQSIASHLADGLPAILASSQVISTLPVSLFGLAIAAAELPALSGAMGTTEELSASRRARLTANSRYVAFLVVPSAVAFIAIGDVLFRVLFQHGRFDAHSTAIGWSILAPSAFGLVASTQARLYANLFYAMHDTRTPVLFSLIRVVLDGIVAYTLALHAPGWLGIDPIYGGAAFGLANGVSGWTEFTLLRRSARRRIGAMEPIRGFLGRVWVAAVIAGTAAFAVHRFVFPKLSVVDGLIVIALFCATYAAASLALRIPEAKAIAGRLLPAR